MKCIEHTMLGKMGGNQDEYPDFFLQSWRSARRRFIFLSVMRHISLWLNHFSLEFPYWTSKMWQIVRGLSSFSTFLFSQQFLTQMKITKFLKCWALQVILFFLPFFRVKHALSIALLWAGAVARSHEPQTSLYWLETVPVSVHHIVIGDKNRQQK